MTAEIQIAGRTYPLGRQIGKGGEGNVYAVDGRADVAAKIYKPSLRSDREQKVRAMVEHRLASTTNLVAFPSEVATDRRGAFLGFLMRLVSGYRPLHELYSPKSRRQHFPKADYRFLVRAALNVTNAIGKVHQTGCVIGDLNHSGILVAQDATVALIDADSFQFSLSGKHFPCVVGVADFTPPELHGQDLSKVVRSQTHDNFGLAVAIFQLLAMGKHPYAGRYAHGDLSMAESIAQNRFAFSFLRAAQVQTTPPPGSIGLKDLPPHLAAGFEAAFGLDPARRPDAAAWSALLGELERSLSRCSQVKTHFYPSAAGTCIWCKISVQSGVDMFPDVWAWSSGTSVPSSFDLQKAIRRLGAIKLPPAPALLPAIGSSATGPSSAVSDYARAGRSQKIKTFLILISALAAAGFAIGTSLGILFWVAAGLGIFWIKELGAENPKGRAFSQAYADTHRELVSQQISHLRRIGYIELQELLGDVRAWIDQHKQLDKRLTTDLHRLTTNRRQRHLEAHLDRFRIRDASITGIGPSKSAVLASYGVDTAADIEPNRILAIPGFGSQLTRNLTDWRLQKERSFSYNPAPDASDKQEEARIRAVYGQARTALEARIQSALDGLERSSGSLQSKATRIDQSLQDAYAAFDQAKYDLEYLSLPLPATSPLSIRVRDPQPMSLPGVQVAVSSPKVSTPPAAGGRTHTSPPQQTTKTTGASPACPQCGSSMVRRLARRGRRAGRHFWGCSRYPRCTGTRN